MALLFVAEYNVRLVWLADYPQVQLPGLLGAVHGWNHWAYRCVVVFLTTFVTFAYLKNKAAVERIAGQVDGSPSVGASSPATALRWASSRVYRLLLYRGGGPSSWANLLEASWFIVGVSAIAFAGVAFLPWGFWAQLIRSTGNLWAYASIAAGSAYAVGNSLQGAMEPASYLTLRLSKIFLIPFVSSIIANPVTRVIGTQRFRVRIGPRVPV